MNDIIPHITFTAIAKNAMYIPAIFVGLSMENYIALAVLLVVDVFTGVWRIAVIEGGSEIVSWKAINGLFSKFLFLLIPVVVAFMGAGLGLELKSLAQSALGILTLATGYSIIGNIYGIRTGKVTKEFDAVRFILKYLETIISRIEGRDINNKK